MTTRSERAQLGVALAAVTLLAAGCSSSGGLPTHDVTFCDMNQVLGPFHIDTSANPPTWAEPVPGGRRINLRWPAGFSLATVDGLAEVLDAKGKVVMTSEHPFPGMLSGSYEVSYFGTATWFDVCEVPGHYPVATP